MKKCSHSILIYKILTVFGFIISLCGCHSNVEDSDNIDYGELSVLDIAIELEIGESAEYVPGELFDLTVFSDNAIMVADWGNMTIEQFNAEGGHIATIANEGSGPGDLPDFFSLVRGANDTLIVHYYGMSQQIDFFSREEDHVYRYIKTWVPDSFMERTMISIAPRSATEYYARESWNNQQVRSMVADRTEYGWVPVTIVNAYQNVLVDSLHLLKRPTSVARISEGGALTILGWPPYQSSDQLRGMDNNRYVIARPDSSVLTIYTHDHEIEKRIPLYVKERPIVEADLDFLFESRNVSDDVRRKLEARVPDEKPVFLNIWVSENYFWLHVDINEDGKKMVILTMEGEPLGTFYLPLYDDIRYVKGNRLYTLHKNPESGHTIRVYKLRL
jgi:hypothetical protein